MNKKKNKKIINKKNFIFKFFSFIQAHFFRKFSSSSFKTYNLNFVPHITYTPKVIFDLFLFNLYFFYFGIFLLRFILLLIIMWYYSTHNIK